MENQETPVVAYCRSCGKSLPTAEQRIVQGTVYCADHAPAASTGDSPWSAAPAPAAVPSNAAMSPALAFILGLIPGVGAIYNAQYAKGLIHVVIFGTLISIANSRDSHGTGPIFVMLCFTWVFYMAFEAYHTAIRRQQGLPVDEFSSLVPSAAAASQGNQVVPVVLIGLGVLFLLNNFEIIQFYQLVRFWPLGLIAIGVLMLVERMRTANSTPTTEVRDEQR